MNRGLTYTYKMLIWMLLWDPLTYLFHWGTRVLVISIIHYLFTLFSFDQTIDLFIIFHFFYLFIIFIIIINYLLKYVLFWLFIQFYFLFIIIIFIYLFFFYFFYYICIYIISGGSGGGLYKPSSDRYEWLYLINFWWTVYRILKVCVVATIQSW